jgi:hypothetical protein
VNWERNGEIFFFAITTHAKAIVASNLISRRCKLNFSHSNSELRLSAGNNGHVTATPGKFFCYRKPNAGHTRNRENTRSH